LTPPCFLDKNKWKLTSLEAGWRFIGRGKAEITLPRSKGTARGAPRLDKVVYLLLKLSWAFGPPVNYEKFMSALALDLEL
jgi:hypothetical protein